MTIFRGKNGQHTESADALVLQRSDLRRSGKPIWRKTMPPYAHVHDRATAVC
nr:hypothetical protein [uncultured Rhodoferax sp.]